MTNITQHPVSRHHPRPEHRRVRRGVLLDPRLDAAMRYLVDSGRYETMTEAIEHGLSLVILSTREDTPELAGGRAIADEVIQSLDG